MSINNHEYIPPENTETPGLDEEVDNLLEIWGVTSDGGRQKRKAKIHYDARKVHPGFIYTDNIKHQHMANLITCMRHFDAIRDDASLAAILATLLEAQNPENLKPQFRARQMAAQTLNCEILMTGYRMLRRHPGATTYEQLQRLLRRAKPFQLSEEGKSAVGILLARLMKEEGHSADAYDALLPLNPPKGSREDYQRKYLLAKIRHGQWTEAMQAAAAPKRRGPSQQPSQQPYRNIVMAPLQSWNPFTNSTQIWGKAGRNGRDLSQEAQVHFEDALALRPEECTDGVIALVEMAVSQGKIQEALELAREHCTRSPLDLDAHAMTLTLLLSSRKASKKFPVSNEEILQRCTSVLQTHCGDGDRAVQVLIKLGKKLPDGALPPLVLLEGLCAYLDTTPPLLKLGGLTLKAWKMLSNCLLSLSEITTSAYQTAKEARDCLRRVQQDNTRSAKGAIAEVDTAAEVMKATQLGFNEALYNYKAVQRLLEQRAWWQDCHLLIPKMASKLTRLVNEGRASTETLIPLSIVHSVQLHAIESLRATKVKLDLTEPSLLFFTDRLATVAKTMQEVGTAEDIHTSYLTTCIIIRRAATVVLDAGEDAVQSTALAAASANIASAANTSVFEEQEMHMGADGVESIQPHWKPCPLGAPHPEIGFLSQLPGAWWSVFPQRRRKEKRKHKKQESAAEEEENEEIAAGGDDMALNNAHIDTQPTQRRVRFNLPSTQVESDMDTD